jgi:hypothetical protein
MSGSSMPPVMSQDDIRQRLEAAGYADVSDIRRFGDTDFTARASKDGQVHTVEIDGHSGHVIWAQ